MGAVEDVLTQILKQGLPKHEDERNRLLDLLSGKTTGQDQPQPAQDQPESRSTSSRSSSR